MTHGHGHQRGEVVLDTLRSVTTHHCSILPKKDLAKTFNA